MNRKALLIIIISAVSLFPFAVYGEQAPLSKLRTLQEDFIRIAEKVKPSVVNISTEYSLKSKDNPSPFRGPYNNFWQEFLEKFLQQMPDRRRKPKSLGSGLIMDREGYILTNNHVVEEAEKITILLSDKKKFEGKVIGKDPKTDIAIVQIDPGDYELKAAELGNSDTCRIGQWAIAIGNPFGLDRTVTVGVISAIGRTDIGIATYENFIQTDASINPGNSGGPLLNLDGEVIGINTAIVSNGQGIGFAVPINMARNIMDQLLEHGKVVRGWMGIAIQTVTEELGRQFGVEEGTGVLVGQVFKGDPADKAGIEEGDILLEFNGTPLTSPTQLSRLAAATLPNKEVELLLLRDGEKKTLTIILGRQKDILAKDGKAYYGMTAQEITPELMDKYNLSEKEGVVVTDVESDSPADRADLRAGDVLLEIQHKKIENIDQYLRIIESLKEAKTVLIARKRDKRSRFVVIESKPKTKKSE
jgi:serine protease Do